MINSVEIYPKIRVYENQFKDLDHTLNVLKEAEFNPEGSMMGPWESWYTFGLETHNFKWDAPESERKNIESNVLKEINDIFYNVTEDYIKKYDVDMVKEDIVYKGESLQTWRKMGPSICKYVADAGVTEDLAMHYHTDYQIERKDEKGYNFSITVTMYLNDDYEGGDIDFYVNKKLFGYKPKAGDILVFPAGDPDFLTDGKELYHHGVKRVKNGVKYFIRNHWQRFHEGSQEWNENAEKYGLEIWEQMEESRKKEGRKRGDYQYVTQEQIDAAIRIR